MNSFICRACSNGCHISFHLISDNRAVIKGYQCRKGIGFAESHLCRDLGRAVYIDNKDRLQALPYSFETFSGIIASWSIHLKVLHPRIAILGSPERTRFRVIVEDTAGTFYKLEKVASYRIIKRETQARILEYLSLRGLSLAEPYLKNGSGDFITRHDDTWWQITPFIKGRNLKRPDYVFDAWRGRVLAEFLIDLRAASADLPLLNKQDSFDLPGYIRDLLVTMDKHDPKVVERVKPAVQFLEESFFPIYPRLPTAFCHGDCHPLNMIWSDDGLKRVIDWEFCGYKAEIYDLANLIGCLGVEDPHSLQGDFVIELIRGVRSSGIISEISWDHLLGGVIALRFAWLSEWLRKKDVEMIELEETYLKLLIDNRDILKESWDKAREGYVFVD
ncbi:MAG: phosphotransferase [Candidatus Omnitrophota bacterium]